MKNQESDYIFLAEGDEYSGFNIGEWNEEKYFDADGNIEDNDQLDGKDCESLKYADDVDDPHSQNKPDSLDPSWPQSYRRSMDLLASPRLSPVDGLSSLSSSPKRRIITSLDKPLLLSETDNQLLQDHHSSEVSLHPQWTSSTKNLLQHQKSPTIRKSSFSQAVFNGVNILCGVAILSIPYAVKQGGWVGLSILFIFCVLTFYTGLLLRDCLDSQPGLETYPDIGEAAFGKAGRLVISMILYAELYANCIEFLIMETDNLSSLYPNTHLAIGGYDLSSHYLFAIMVTLAVLPTVWLRDMSVLSYISAGGVFVTAILVICLFWVGLVDNIGFRVESTETLNLSTLPVAIGLYGYCYGGHALFPNVYTSMEKRSLFPLVLLTSFAICILLYAGVAIMGYMMFGESIESQFTLNLPSDFLATKVAVWATVINPFTKYALSIAPVAMCLEELIPSNHLRSQVSSLLIRTTLVASTLLVALCFPFFGLVMSLIGSLMTMLVSFIFPCACFLRIFKGNVTRFQGSLCVLIITIGIVSAVLGTYTSLSEIFQQFLKS